MIVSHADDELLFDPDQQMPEVETGRVKTLYKIEEQGPRRCRRVAAGTRLAIRNRCTQTGLEQQSSFFRRQVVVVDRPLDAVPTISPVQISVLVGVVDPVWRVRVYHPEATST